MSSKQNQETPWNTGSEEGESTFEFSAPEQTAQNPMSVALLFYLVSVCALFLACLRTVTFASERDAISWVLVRGAVIGVVCGFFLAMFLMRKRDLPMMGAMGLIVGLAAAGLAFVSAESHMEIMLIAFFGCWLQIVFNCVAARFR